jgi:hypothetical protein
MQSTNFVMPLIAQPIQLSGIMWRQLVPHFSQAGQTGLEKQAYWFKLI